MVNSEECSICKDVFEVKDETTHLTCAHGFHTACIDKWLSRSRTCPICRERVDSEDVDENDNDSEDEVHADVELVDAGNGEFVPRYIGEYRYHRDLDAYVTPEDGIIIYFFKIVVFLLIAGSIVSSAFQYISPVLKEAISISPKFSSDFSQLEIINDRKCIRNSGFNHWNKPLKKMYGIAGPVPVRFLDFTAIVIGIQYDIQKEIKNGDIILQIGFIPTKFMDKDRFINEQGLAVTIVVHESDVRLVISNFGVIMRDQWLSENKIKTTFVGTVILIKQRQHISVYLRANSMEDSQELYYSTDMPYTQAQGGKVIHTFEYINNNRNDMWPVFNACDRKKAVVSISSTLLHEPSCNKNIYISKDGQQITNSKKEGFMKCGNISPKMKTVNTIFARSLYSFHSFNPFTSHVKTFSFDLEIAKGLNSETEPRIVFQLRIESQERKFVIGLALVENTAEVIYWYHNSTTAVDYLPLENSFGLKKFTFTVEVNYHTNTVKTDVRDPAGIKRYPHEFSNVAFYEIPYIYVGMTNEAVMEACFH